MHFTPRSDAYQSSGWDLFSYVNVAYTMQLSFQLMTSCCSERTVFPDSLWLSLLFLYQRISAFSILCDLYRAELLGANPFMLFFLDSVEQSTDLCEKRFLVDLLCSVPSNREVSGWLTTSIDLLIVSNH
jgi:hypothetical protein